MSASQKPSTLIGEVLYLQIVDVTTSAPLDLDQDREMCIRGPTIMKVKVVFDYERTIASS